MPGVSIHVGGKDETEKPTGFKPVPQDGYYRLRINHADTDEKDDGATVMTKVLFSAVGYFNPQDGTEEETEGGAEFVHFSFPPDDEAMDKKYNQKRQNWRIQNLIKGMGFANVLDRLEEKKKKAMTVTPSDWVGREVIAEVNVRTRTLKDKETGEERKFTRAQIVECVDEATLRERLGLDEETDEIPADPPKKAADKSKTKAADKKSTKKSEPEPEVEETDDEITMMAADDDEGDALDALD